MELKPEPNVAGAVTNPGKVDVEAKADERNRIWKNLIVLGISFALLFAATTGISNLQSSIFGNGGLGVRSLAVVFVGMILSSLFLPPLCLAKLGCKWTLLFSTSGFVLYVAVQFYPRFETMIPVGIYAGLCSAPLWAAQSAYVTMIAEEYARLESQELTSVLQRFFGTFYVFFQASQVFGNLISSLVLTQSGAYSDIDMNSTLSFEHCGANFCDDTHASDIKLTNVTTADDGTNEYAVLVGIFVGCTLFAALLIGLFLDSLKRYGENERRDVATTKNSEWYSLFLATIRHWEKPVQILLIPISIWLGVQEGIWAAEFTKSYITCAWGVEMIGYVLMCYGSCSAVSSFVVGKIIGRCGRPTIFLAAASFNAACLVTMLYWIPSPSDHWVFFALSCGWGIADGVWAPQVKAFYGTLFSSTREAAFSNTTVWMSTGYIIVFFSSDLMCMSSKLYMYLGLLVIAMIGYGIVEVISRSQNSKPIVI